MELVTLHFTQSITAELAETKYLDNAFDAAVSSYFSQLMAQLFVITFVKSCYISELIDVIIGIFLSRYLKFA